MNDYIWMFGILVAHVVFHELGHVIAVTTLGGKVTKIGWHWWPTGPYVRRTDAGSPERNALVALAGLAANFLFMLVPIHMHHWSILVGCDLMFFNLIPIRASDMGQFLMCLKARRLGIRIYTPEMEGSAQLRTI